MLAARERSEQEVEAVRREGEEKLLQLQRSMDDLLQASTD